MARPAQPQQNRTARSSRQVSRFYRSINPDRVLGTHTRHKHQIASDDLRQRHHGREDTRSLSRERYWVALKIWSAWANKNQSQNPVTATKTPEKTRLERRFCVILHSHHRHRYYCPSGQIVCRDENFSRSNGTHPS